MTKEELKKEAERKCVDDTHYCIGGFGGNAYCEGYLAGAEPREKRIADLEATNKKISDECHKLVDSLEKKQKDVADLEKENTELKRNYDKRGNIITSLENQLRMHIHSDKTNQVTKAKDLLQKCLNTYLRDPGLRDEVEKFLKELEK